MKSSKVTTQPFDCERIGVIFPGALGDLVCLLPSLQALSQELPIDLFARSEFAEILPARVTVRSLERAEISRLFVDDGQVDERLRGFFGRYRSIFSWLGSGQPAFVKNLNRVSNGKAKLFGFRPASSMEHQIDYYLRCLKLDVDARTPRLTLRAEAVRWREKYWAVNALQRRAILTLAPGSGAGEKNWPEEQFCSLAEWWRAATGGIVVVLIGPVEQERGGFEALQRDCLMLRNLSLAQVAAVIARSDVYLGNDSGISHLAAALGVRSVVLFGPTSFRQWAPRGKKVTVMSREVDCSPCSVPIMKGCPHHACLTGLNVRDVIELLAQLPELATLTR